MPVMLVSWQDGRGNNDIRKETQTAISFGRLVPQVHIDTYVIDVNHFNIFPPPRGSNYQPVHPVHNHLIEDVSLVVFPRWVQPHMDRRFSNRH